MDRGPYPYNEYQEAWLRDLETTTEPQTTGWLHRLNQGSELSESPGFCCLGRACVVLNEEPRIGMDVVSYDDCETVLPWHIEARLQLRDDDGRLASGMGQLTSLADMNDSGWTFKEIAAYIRGNPWNVFLGPDEEPQD
jgi:hypothetical protein